MMQKSNLQRHTLARSSTGHSSIRSNGSKLTQMTAFVSAASQPCRCPGDHDVFPGYFPQCCAVFKKATACYAKYIARVCRTAHGQLFMCYSIGMLLSQIGGAI
jgi:hypothetical protein